MGYKQKGDHEQPMLRRSCDVELHSKYILGWCVFNTVLAAVSLSSDWAKGLQGPPPPPIYQI